MKDKLKGKVLILVPVYKEEVDPLERISLQQLQYVLTRYPIAFFGPSDLDLQAYLEIIPHASFYPFSRGFFLSTHTYNDLLLSKDFYERFAPFEYIFIHQTDGFVFRDELMDWCDRGYDYIGAPWFYNYGNSHQDGALWKVGNGGVSLRKISSFLKLLSSFHRVYFWKEIWSSYSPLERLYKWPFIIGKTFGIKNNYRFYAEHYRKNEDQFFGEFVRDLNKPDVWTAARFSFEKDPEYLYRALKQLPFACHAWTNEDLLPFWEPFVKKMGYDI